VPHTCRPIRRPGCPSVILFVLLSVVREMVRHRLVCIVGESRALITSIQRPTCTSSSQRVVELRDWSGVKIRQQSVKGFPSSVAAFGVLRPGPVLKAAADQHKRMSMVGVMAPCTQVHQQSSRFTKASHSRHARDHWPSKPPAHAPAFSLRMWCVGLVARACLSQTGYLSVTRTIPIGGEKQPCNMP
jgi:hypothetical protein